MRAVIQRRFCAAPAGLNQTLALSVGLVWLALAGASQAADQDVVINEIMYHPPSGQTNLQWVELFNRGAGEVNLSKWAFTKGISFTFPGGTTLGANHYLVVCRDLTAFRSHYGQQIPAVGNFTGALKHKGERLELADAQGQKIDSVKYSARDEWPRGADGYSCSLERICPSASSEDSANWAASNWPVSKRAAGTPGRENDNFSTNLPPEITAVELLPRAPVPRQPVRVTATVKDTAGIRSVTLLYRVASSGRESEERPVAMQRVSGDERAGVYAGQIDGQLPGQLVRYRIQAIGQSGARRFLPSPNEPRPALSFLSFTNSMKSTIPIGQLVTVGRLARGPAHYQQNPGRQQAPPLRGTDAFIYVPPDTGEAEVFDFVHVITRSGGYKVHFHKDRPLKGMTGINLISEGSVRWILSEPLSYVLYRMAGVPSPLTEHVRLSLGDRLLGFHLLVEQPNKAFLARNGRDDTGNMYKLIWYGRGITGQHEKKTNPNSGYADLLELVEGLRRKSGADQWAFIQQHLNVDEFINYYAVNMCIQNWDGFFNNYFAYHDTAKTGKWEIYPWDEDKTWGDYDGASPRYDWYTMPLTFGMNGDRSPRDFGHFGGGPFGGVSWWRPPGYFSGPLLANPEFRKRFLARLREICDTAFTEESMFPIIEAMQKRLEPEVRIRARAIRQDEQSALREFDADMDSFRRQVQNRRKFILGELNRAK